MVWTKADMKAASWVALLVALSAYQSVETLAEVMVVLLVVEMADLLVVEMAVLTVVK